MTRLIASMTASALALALIGGCTANEEPVVPAQTDDMPGAPTPGDDVVGPGDADSAALTDEQIETIRQLPEADAELALVQKMCPVSDEPLGSMGVPIKMDVQGRAVFICCAGCKGEVEQNPDAILAKVPQGGPELGAPGSP